MTFLSTLKSGVIAGAAVLASVAGVATAQDDAPVSLQDVLRDAQQARREAAQENREREQRFIEQRAQQQQRLSTVRSEVNAAERRSDELDAQFRANDERIGELTAELERQQGEFGELFGAARSAAADLAAQVENSVISAELPGRAEDLRETAQSTTLPSVEELEEIYITHIEEMAGQAEVKTFNAAVVVDASGDTQRNAPMTRIGPFVAFNDGRYFTVQQTQSGRSRLTELARQPGGASAVPNARGVEGHTGSGYVEGTIDPTAGQLLQLVIQSPSLQERIDQGGPVGRVIIGVFILGTILGLYKLVTLFLTNASVKGQVRRKTGSRGNPLGRVMMAYESNTNADVETLQLKLDDAVLRELPRLESGLNILKVLAAVAPLLGLLGTVVGMIITFQQITLFGTGDPQIMAGGISQALVTTVLGLIAAIPLLLLHALAAGSAKSVSNTLEEQAAGMIAEHAESR